MRVIRAIRIFEIILNREDIIDICFIICYVFTGVYEVSVSPPK